MNLSHLDLIFVVRERDRLVDRIKLETVLDKNSLYSFKIKTKSGALIYIRSTTTEHILTFVPPAQNTHNINWWSALFFEAKSLIRKIGFRSQNLLYVVLR